MCVSLSGEVVAGIGEIEQVERCDNVLQCWKRSYLGWRVHPGWIGVVISSPEKECLEGRRRVR